MLETFNSELEIYNQKWQQLVSSRQDKQFFESLKPVALGWKVSEMSDYYAIRDELHEQSDRIIETWMNGRWVVKICLRDEARLAGGISIVKVLQRRPGSDDALGLDHVDFFVPGGADIASKLQDESDLNWSEESNDVIAGYEWQSIWFDNTEAKLKSDTVLNIVAAELTEASNEITGKS